MLEVWNKIDLLPLDAAEGFRTAAERDDRNWATSAITGEGLPELYEAIEEALQEPVFDEQMNLSFAQGKQRAWLYAHNVVTSEAQSDDGYQLELRWSKKTRNQYHAMAR